tara:strand:+ start:1128 stop:1766 length:639 start_codon:yes stop_codon:yes gene_type:complete
MKFFFIQTYKNNKWTSPESFSGVGSQLNYTYSIRIQLEKLILSKKINTIFDCSCGDWNWMKFVDLYGAHYTGNDIVPEIVKKNNDLYSKSNVKFINNDCLTALEQLKENSIDLVICRHTLEHLETGYCVEVCKQIRRVSNFALITSNNTDNDDSNSNFILDGHSGRQIDLEKSPFLEILDRPIKRMWDSKGYNKTKASKYNGINLYQFGEEL